ncbi:MAG TPA: ferritin-like domain-containing protein [Thermoleophilaceae bacterium]|nr:ferritin-like domain-containing protein [Thermoleophilaceae bacterium]
MSRTRRDLLILGLLTGGALSPALAVAQRRSSRESLEDLLGRERRLAMAYEAALRRDAVEPAVGEVLLAHERAHVQGLERTLRGGPEPEATVPDPELTRALGGRRSFAEYALGLETETLGVYSDAVPYVRDAELRKALGSIMTCIGTHQVALRRLLAAPLVVHPR